MKIRHSEVLSVENDIPAKFGTQYIIRCQTMYSIDKNYFEGDDFATSKCKLLIQLIPCVILVCSAIDKTYSSASILSAI